MASAEDDWSALLALQRATHVTLDAVGAEIAELKLGPAEMNVLANLGTDGGRTISELAAAVGSRATTMTSVLDRLERRGLIARSPVPHDRRAIRVDLTPSGRRAAAAVRRAFQRVELRALGTLPPRSISALREALDALARTADGHR